MNHLSGLLPFWFNTMKKHWFGCPSEIDELVFKTWNHALDLEYEKTDDIKINLSKINLASVHVWSNLKIITLKSIFKNEHI